MSLPGPGRYQPLHLKCRAPLAAPAFLRFGSKVGAVALCLQRFDQRIWVQQAVALRLHVSNFSGEVDGDVFNAFHCQQRIPHTADAGNASSHAGDIKLHRLIAFGQRRQGVVIGGALLVLPAEIPGN